MALLLELDTKEKGAGNYWKITNINMNAVDKTSRIKISLFKDKEARAVGKDPIDSKQYVWDRLENPFTFDTINVLGLDPIELAYKKIKHLPEWQKAQDI